MIFVDEKGNLADAIVRKKHVSRFKNKLIKGSLFTIKNFKVVESSGVYRPFENSLKIIFFPSTVIKILSKDIVDIFVNGVHFIKPELIESRVNNNMILSDVVGCLYEVGDMKSARSKWRKRDIQIITDYDCEVSFSSTYASKVYVNLDIYYTRSLKQKFSTMSTGVQVIESSNINSILTEEEVFMNRMNIKNLLDFDWSADI
ncbi:hypothetical protein P3S68_021508 [Capsicum galapagoense]